MKPAAILALLFLALALLSFLLYFLLPNIVAFWVGWDPRWGDVERICPAQQPIEPVYECKSKPGDPCVGELASLTPSCSLARQYLLWFGAICLLLSLVSAAYHFIVKEKVKSGSARSQ